MENLKVTEYKKNHYIPRVILKNWITSGQYYNGIHVFEINSKQFSFSEAKGRGGFSFAMINNLYVPIIEGERVVNGEKWLSGLESAIGKILPIILMGNEIKYPDNLTAVKFIMGLLSLEYRSEYLLSLFRSLVANDIDVQTFLGFHSNRTIDQIVVENLVNSVDDFFRQIIPVKMRILQPASGEFIVTDRPVIPEIYVNERIIVVSPKTAIALSKGTIPFGYQYVPISEEFTNQINELLASRARSWIAGTSKIIVEKYSKIVGSDKWLELKNNEKVQMLPFKEISQGWEFKKQ